MKVSLNLLKQYVDLSNFTIEEIAKRLTFAGIEVEAISHMAEGTNLVIGEILTCEEHPDSNHLHVLNVDLGPKYGVTQIVCGAPNARKGLKVIVSRVGAKLIGGEIKASVIRGVESNGMCCSLLELGVDSKYLSEEQTKGIEELPLDAEVGNEEVLKYLGLDDVIFEINVLANRPDLLSVANVAREIAALLTDSKINIPNYEDKSNFKSDFVVSSLTNRCKQFAVKEIRGVKNASSPLWMKSYLQAMGVRSISALVDIGNYVMLVTGQPLHMYDEDKLEKHELIVKDDKEEKFIALDEKEYQLIKGDIVITSNDKSMCLGGVMGSLACACDENTKNIVIEAASFDGASIRHTSNRLGLASESSSRFVKGTNHFQYEYVLNFAASLVRELCDAKEESDIVSYLNEKYEKQVVVTSLKKINERLGTDFDLESVKKVLKNLYFEVEEKGEELCISVPQFRLDITSNADIAEEVIRYLGFDNVKSELPLLRTTVGSLSEKLAKTRIVEDYLIDQGFDETISYTLVSKKEKDEFKYLLKGENYQILNPLTEDREYVRLSILPSLLSIASYNVKRQNKNFKIFEIADLISKDESKKILSIVMVGENYLRGKMSRLAYDFYDAKGVLEGLMEIFGITQTRYTIERNDIVSELHPGKSAVIKFGKNVVGYLGELHPNYLKEKDLIKNNVVVLELSLDALFDMKTGNIKMQEISKFPTVSRDLALLVSKKIEVKDLIKEIKMSSKGLIQDVEIFDIFESESLGIDLKSVALSITYGSNNHTLKDDEVNASIENIKKILNDKFHAVLRG